jgi:hypothetical protein
MGQPLPAGHGSVTVEIIRCGAEIGPVHLSLLDFAHQLSFTVVPNLALIMLKRRFSAGSKPAAQAHSPGGLIRLPQEHFVY